MGQLNHVPLRIFTSLNEIAKQRPVTLRSRKVYTFDEGGRSSHRKQKKSSFESRIVELYASESCDLILPAAFSFFSFSYLLLEHSWATLEVLLQLAVIADEHGQRRQGVRAGYGVGMSQTRWRVRSSPGVFLARRPSRTV